MILEKDAEEVVSFADLNEDCLLEVLKYLDLRSRTRLERVQRQWQRLAAHLWTAQRSLSFNPFDGLLRECRRRGHQIRFAAADCLPLDGLKPVYCKEEAMLAVLARCPNLVVLHLRRWSRHRTFGLKLARSCPRLEHIMGRNRSVAGHLESGPHPGPAAYDHLFPSLSSLS